MGKKRTFLNAGLLSISLFLLIPFTFIAGKYVTDDTYKEKASDLVQMELLTIIPVLLVICILLFLLNAIGKNRLNVKNNRLKNLFFLILIIIYIMIFLAAIYQNILLSYIGFYIVLFIYIIMMVWTLNGNHRFVRRSVFFFVFIIFTVLMYRYIHADLSDYKLANYKEDNLILSREFEGYNNFVYQNKQYYIKNGNIYDENEDIFIELPSDYFGNVILDKHYLYFEVNTHTKIRFEFIEAEGLPFILYPNKYGLIEYRRLNLDTKEIDVISKSEFKIIERQYCDKYDLYI